MPKMKLLSKSLTAYKLLTVLQIIVSPITPLAAAFYTYGQILDYTTDAANLLDQAKQIDQVRNALKQVPREDFGTFLQLVQSCRTDSAKAIEKIMKEHKTPEKFARDFFVTVDGWLDIRFRKLVSLGWVYDIVMEEVGAYVERMEAQEKKDRRVQDQKIQDQKKKEEEEEKIEEEIVRQPLDDPTVRAYVEGKIGLGIINEDVGAEDQDQD